MTHHDPDDDCPICSVQPAADLAQLAEDLNLAKLAEALGLAEREGDDR